MPSITRFCLAPAFLIVICLCGRCACAASLDGSLAKAPGPEPSAEEVLSGTIPGRPPALPVEELRDAHGFATDRLYHVPPVGQHPRVLFSAEDLPRIRRQLAGTDTGRQLTAELADAANLPETKPGDWVAAAYWALVAGDVKKYEGICAGAGGIPSGPPGSVAAPVNALLFFRVLDAQLRGDAKRGQEVAGAVVAYTDSLRPKVELALGKPGAENFWLELRNVTPDLENVGFLYDLAQPYMTKLQADRTRDFIVLCTKGHYGLGMDLPRHWRRWNFIGMGLNFPLMAMSIEGEPGYDRRIVDRGAEVARDYILYSLSRQGVGREAIGYQTAGISHFDLLAMALASRGNNLLTLKPCREMLENWFLWTLQPFGRLWESGGDLGTFPPNQQVVEMGRFFYPDSMAIKVVADQSSPKQKLDLPFPQDNLVKIPLPRGIGVELAGEAAPGISEEPSARNVRRRAGHPLHPFRVGIRFGNHPVPVPFGYRVRLA